MQQPFFELDPAVRQAGQDALERARPDFQRIDEITEYNQLKVLSAFIRHGVSESHFVSSTGYGYDDRGRDTLDRVFADVMGAEDALMRHTFACGTHTLAVALYGVLRPGDTMLSATGTPYDTIHSVIGLSGEGQGSLKDFGVRYRQAELGQDGLPDLSAICAAIDPSTKMVYIQRSRGYSLRPSLSVRQIGEVVRAVKAVKPDVIVMVDNCYGEFVEESEPLSVGADLIAGSLIKNPGGGIAPTGGYIAGRADLIEQCACRLTAPGVGKEVGCTLGQLRGMFMGLFFAPTVVAAALKTAVFSAALFERLGFEVYPHFDAPRTDIIQAVKLGTPEGLSAFCRGVQKGAPVDAFVTPEAWDMPGYDSKVIMAAGAFTMGASIELSADGPMREPYAAWLQGGLTWPSGKTGAILAAQSLLESGVLRRDG